MEKIKIDTVFIRLDALLKFSGAIVTGGQAKLAIQNGEVIVNSEVCTMRGKKIGNGDIVSYNGKTYEVQTVDS